MTRATVVAMCSELGDVFGKGYEFGPAVERSGGIEMVTWPGTTICGPGRKYFLFRVRSHNEEPWPKVEYPIHARDEWREAAKDAIIWSVARTGFPNESGRMIVGNLYYRAGAGTPKWTVDEISKVVNVLRNFGFEFGLQGPVCALWDHRAGEKKSQSDEFQSMSADRRVCTTKVRNFHYFSYSPLAFDDGGERKNKEEFRVHAPRTCGGGWEEEKKKKASHSLQ
jgi:hypothetical protein